MLPEKPEIERMARLLCQLYCGDPDRLEAGNLAPHSSFDEELYQNAGYDDLFDNDPAYAPDGRVRGDPAMYIWRDHVFKAVAVLAHK